MIFTVTPYKIALMFLNVQYALSEIFTVDDRRRKWQLGRFLAHELRVDGDVRERTLLQLCETLRAAIDDHAVVIHQLIAQLSKQQTVDDLFVAIQQATASLFADDREEKSTFEGSSGLALAGTVFSFFSHTGALSCCFARYRSVVWCVSAPAIAELCAPDVRGARAAIRRAAALHRRRVSADSRALHHSVWRRATQQHSVAVRAAAQRHEQQHERQRQQLGGQS